MVTHGLANSIASLQKSHISLPARMGGIAVLVFVQTTDHLAIYPAATLPCASHVDILYNTNSSMSLFSGPVQPPPQKIPGRRPSPVDLLRNPEQ